MSKVKNSRLQKGLQELLEKMTVSEKRDFKKNSKFWGGNPSYLKLFAYLNQPRKKAEPYPSTENIKRTFGWTAAQVSSVTRYLFDKILASLRTAPQSAAELHELYQKIQDIQILVQKEIYPASLELIEFCKTRAFRIDKPLVLLELLYLQKKVLVETGVRNLREQLDTLSAQEKETRLLFERYLYLNDLYLHIALQNQKGEQPDPDLVKKIIQLKFKPIDQKSFNNQILLYQIQIDFLRCKARFAIEPEPEPIPFARFLEEAFGFQQQIMKIFKQDDVFLKEYEERYLTGLDRFLTISLHLNRLEQFKFYEKDFRNFRHRLQYYRNIVHLNLLRHIQEKQFLEGCWFIEEDKHLLERKLAEHRANISHSRLAVIFFACAQLYFITEKFGPAQKWLRKVESLDEHEIQPVLIVMTNLLTLVVQFELRIIQRHDHPQAFVDALERFIRRKKIEDEFVELLLEAFRTLIRHDDVPARTTLEPFLETGKALMAKKEKGHPYLLLLWWMDSRISVRKMSTLADQYM